MGAVGGASRTGDDVGGGRIAPDPPKGDKPEKDGRRCEPHGRWWEVRAARAMMGGASRTGNDGSCEVKVWGNSYLLALTF